MSELIEQAAKDLDSGDGAPAYHAKVKLRNEAARVGKNDADKAKFAAGLAEAVLATSQGPQGPRGRRGPSGAKYKAATRRELLRFLTDVAGAAEVPALVKLLADLDVRDTVRGVLENIADASAVAALAAAAAKATGTDFRLGAIAALGRKPGASSIDALRECAADPDPRIRAAAAAALANHPEPGFDALIKAALDPAKGLASHHDCTTIRLRLAAALAKAGKKAEAEKIYRDVASAGTAAQKKAAEIGVKA